MKSTIVIEYIRQLSGIESQEMLQFKKKLKSSRLFKTIRRHDVIDSLG